MGWISNSFSHFILGLSQVLQESGVDSSAQTLSDASLQTFEFLSRELERLTWGSKGQCRALNSAAHQLLGEGDHRPLGGTGSPFLTAPSNLCQPIHLDPKWHRGRNIKVSSPCCWALKPWRRRGYPIRRVPPGVIPARREVVETDASLLGWVAVWQHRTIKGRWSTQHRWEQGGACSHLHRGHLSSIPHQVGTGFKLGLRVSEQLLTRAYPHFLSLSAVHLPGVQNSVVDVHSCHGSQRATGDSTQRWWKLFGADMAEQRWKFLPQKHPHIVPLGTHCWRGPALWDRMPWLMLGQPAFYIP